MANVNRGQSVSLATILKRIDKRLDRLERWRGSGTVGGGGGDAYLGNNQTFTGNNTFTQTIIAAASGITFGGDTNLYRNNSATIKTDDQFAAVGTIYSEAQISTETSSDSYTRAMLSQTAGGASKPGLSMGTGVAAPDATVHRLAANQVSVAGAMIGDIGHGTTYMGFQHDDLAADGTKYALLQDASGATYMNAATGQAFSWRIGNSQVGYVNSTEFLFGKPLNMNSNKITALDDPDNPQEAATKAYADSLVTGGSTSGITAFGTMEWYGHSGSQYYASEQWRGFAGRVSAMFHADDITRSLAGGEGVAHATGWGWFYRWINDSPLFGTVDNRWVARRSFVSIFYGFNDLPKLGPSLANQQPLLDAYEAMISRARSTQIFEHDNATVALGGGGTWTTTSASSGAAQWASGGSYTKNTSSTGTVTISVPSDFPGGTVVLAFLSSDNGYGSNWSISVDGGGATTEDTRNRGWKVYGGSYPGGWVPVVHRLTGLSAGAHTIVATTGTVSTETYFDCWWAEALVPTLVCVPLSWKPVNWSDYSGSPYNVAAGLGETDRTTLNSRIQTVVDTFDSKVFTVSFDGILDGTSDAKDFYDNLHLSDRGFAKAAKAVADEIIALGTTISDQAYTNAGAPFISRSAQNIERNTIESTYPSIVPFAIRSKRGGDQTADLQQWLESDNTRLVGITEDGKIEFGTGTDANIRRTSSGVISSNAGFALSGNFTTTGVAYAKYATTEQVALGIDTGGAASSILFYTDTYIKRTGANVLSSNAGIGFTGNITSSALIYAYFADSKQTVLGYANGGVNPGITFGSGLDSWIYRTASAELTTVALKLNGVLTPSTSAGIEMPIGTSFAPPNFGNNTTGTATAQRCYFSQVYIPHNATITGVSFTASATGSGQVRSSMYDSTGARVANRTTDQAVALGQNKVAFSSTYAAKPGIYYIALTLSSATTTYNQTSVASPSSVVAGPGSNATPTSITPPTSNGSAQPTMITY